MNAPLAPGTLLDNRYRVVGVAKRGAFGQTYLIRDQKQFNELCVLKEFVPVQQDPVVVDNLLQLFHREASVLYGLRHPQLPRPRAMISQGQRFYWVREYVEGKSYGVLLDARKDQGHAFAEAEVIQLLVHVLPVLGYLHNRGVVHGNISPDSLILRQQDQLPVLINYGLVRDLVVRLQLHPVPPEAALGSWGYVPPEKLRDRKLYPNSDLYSLAITAITLLTGRSPEALYNQQTQTFEWEQLTTVSPKFARVLKQMMAPQPQRRYASAAEVSQAIAPLVETADQTTAVGAAAPTPAVTAPPLVATSVPSMPPPPSAEVVAPPADAPIVEDVPRVRQRPRQQRNSNDPRASLALVIGIVLLVSVIGWRVVSGMLGQQPAPQSAAPPVEGSSAPVPETEVAPPAPSPAVSPSVGAAPQKPVAASPSPVAPAVKGVPPEQVQAAGINNQYFVNLTNVVASAQGSPAKGQVGSKTSQKAITSAEVLRRLGTLSPATRKKLGSYTLTDYNRWLAELGETGKKSSPTLDSLTDGRFYQLFPEWRGRQMDTKTMGQVWYAIAEETVPAAKARLATKKS